jgi:hypothetical protein
MQAQSQAGAFLERGPSGAQLQDSAAKGGICQISRQEKALPPGRMFAAGGFAKDRENRLGRD